ncbi:MAG: hypothetical protein Q8K89_09315 [Actinomycetota bacterium]|nr:hypothetical protein [Actinomycetota bacterium]
MRTECLQAHETISLAYDGEAVTSEDLRNAKTHCAGCPDCAAFVAGLARIRQIPAPQATEASIDRALVSVKRVSDALAAREAKDVRDAADAADAPARPKVLSFGRSLPAWSGWVATAAAVVLAVGVITANGIRYMNAPAESSISQSGMGAESSADYSAVPAPSDDALQGSASASKSYDLNRAGAPEYVVFQGFVYAVDPKPETLSASATRLGSLPSDLGTGEVRECDVYAGSSPGAIIVSGDRTSTYAATAIVRQFNGASFGLASSEITKYGVWPEMPQGIAQPTAEDGSPVFEEGGKDDSRIAIYVLPGVDPSAGFAIAPGTSSSDPAAGNPNWTWWVPLK